MLRHKMLEKARGKKRGSRAFAEEIIPFVVMRRN